MKWTELPADSPGGTPRRKGGSLRRILQGMACGFLGLGILLGLTSRSEQQSGTAVARPFTGPSRGTTAMKGTVGADWMGPTGPGQAHLKAGRAEYSSTPGLGDSTAKGEAGSTWGPQAGAGSQSESALRRAHVSLARTPGRANHPSLTSSPARRASLATPDAEFGRPLTIPGSLRHTKAAD